MRTRRTFGLATLVAASACAIAVFGAPLAQSVVTYNSSFGGSGTGNGQFSAGNFDGPGGVAYSESNGHVYVADPGQHRVQEFDADGNFVRMFGQGVNQTQGTNVCTAVSGDTCQAGQSGSAGGSLSNPRGVGVNDATGDVFVHDVGNNRVQKFSATGDFILTWGRNVNFDTGGDICTASSGDSCKAGAISGDASTTPPTPSANGGFAGYNQALRPNLTVDDAGFVYVSDPNAVPNARVQKFASDGSFVSQIAAPNVDFFDRGLNHPNGIAVDSVGNLYVLDENLVKRFDAGDFTPDGQSAAYDATYSDEPGIIGPGPRAIGTDPENDFLLVEVETDLSCPGGGPAPGTLIREFHPSGQQVDCTAPTSPLLDNDNGDGGMAISPAHEMFLGDEGSDMIHVFETPVASTPTVGTQTATQITAKSARIGAPIAGNLSTTTYHIEYGAAACSANPCASTQESASVGASFTPLPISFVLEDLEDGTPYFYRVVATNGEGTVAGPDRSFSTFPLPDFDPSCSNNLERQQTSAAFLLDCRAYELVSAENQGGYNVTSDLVPGQTPFGGYPEAGDTALYSTHNGGIPGAGNSTNRGRDPYVATRDAGNKRWNTSYVGIPADIGSDAPFSSTVAGADSSLGTFAFGGGDICDPCFADGSAGIPVRMPNGALVQGMAGSIPVADPQPTPGVVKKHLSADGSTFLFASEQRFLPAGNDSNGHTTIYANNLGSGSYRIVSRDENGAVIQNGTDLAALDVSQDGSRVLFGVPNTTDAEGNVYYDLYMNLASQQEALEISTGGSGALFNGMTSDGSQVFFTTRDNLDDDTDASADLFRATIDGGASIERVSVGSGVGDTDACDPAGNSYNAANWNTILGGPTDCSVVPVGGSGGVASDSGAVYFLSPEQLDGGGVAGAPNLFMARLGEDPQFVATLESEANAALAPSSHVFDRSFGSFTRIVGAATDDDGAYYALDAADGLLTPAGSVSKYDAGGNSVPGFSITGIVTVGDGGLLGQPAGGPTGITVDNNPGSPNYGDLYVPSFDANVRRYDSDGNLEATISGLGGGLSGPMAVAVQPGTGNVYVLVCSLGGTGCSVEVFDPSGSPTAPTSFSAGGGGTVAWGIGVNSAGTVYVAQGNGVEEYDSTGASVGTFDPTPSLGVAVDAADDHVYVDHRDEIVEYDSSGTQVGTTFGDGILTDSVGLGVHGGRVIASNQGSQKLSAFTAPVTPPSRSYDSELVINSVRNAETTDTTDFQTTPSGDHAGFSSVLPITGFDASGRFEVFRYDASGDQIDCVSCNPTGATPLTDASMASNGLSLTDAGGVFFTTGEPLVLRDSNARKDAYQWDEEDGVELISTGQSEFDSGLLSVSSDGTNAFFFTREKLTPNDNNGNLMKLYTARADGGFFFVPPEPACAASDECHGPGSEPVGRANIGTLAGDGVNPAPATRSCNTRKLARLAKGRARRAKILRRRAIRVSRRRATVSNRRAIRRLRKRARRFSRVAKRTSGAAKRCRQQTAARRTR